jgi:DNA mismatch repair protein MutL
MPQERESRVAVIRLPEHVVNRIAAGEVIERPASVVKELAENAIDAGATRISIVTANGGKNLIRVSDDGRGMDRQDLALSVERHCTSKLAEDLLDIRTLGFRGEALPSIGAVSRLSVTSRAAGASDSAWTISVSGGRLDGPRPAALSGGTVVEVSDLFFATPARLKFLKNDRAEASAITEVVKRVAIAFPQIRFSLTGTDRSALELPPSDRSGRLADVIGREFIESAVEIDAAREGVRLSGLAGLPAFNRGNALWQYFYVNGRPVRDRLLAGALRGAYSDFLARDRHPAAALFIELDPHLVDVNVHPAKADVRFRDPGLVSGLIVGAIREALAGASGQGSAERGNALLSTLARSGTTAWRPQPAGLQHDWRSSPFAPQQTPGAPMAGFGETQGTFEGTGPSAVAAAPEQELPSSHPLGAARAQIHRNYIVAQTENGLVIVDQHAAHERIVYEALKAAIDRGMPSQMLLIPEIVEMPEEDVDRLLALAADFAKLGLHFEGFGPGAIAVRETPAMLGEVDAQALMRDLADAVAEWQDASGLRARLDAIASRMACHGSVRSGRQLKPDEMNALLRQIEATPNSGVCNHGRPTFIELKLTDIERLFGR